MIKQSIPYTREKIIEHIAKKATNPRAKVYRETAEFWQKVLDEILRDSEE